MICYHRPFVYLLVIILFTIMVLSGTGFAEDTPEVTPAGVSLSTLSYYTEPLPPYNYEENGTLKGLSIDILKAVSEQIGEEIPEENIHVVPWAEAYQSALEGNNTVIFTTARTPERENLFKWAGPISTGNYVLFARNDSSLSISGPEDLKNLRIGVKKDDFSIRQLLGSGVNESQLVVETDISTLVSKLENNEIDLWCYPESAGYYVALQKTGRNDSVTMVYPLEDVGIYYAFTNDVPDSVVKRFQDTLDALKQTKEGNATSKYALILTKYLS